MVKLVAVSGSLRQDSANTTLLRAAIAIAPTDVEIDLYQEVGGLPQFNPDIEPEPPSIVEDLRTVFKGCDGVIIASPEYAHGVPGALKNMLDWLVGSTDLADKPVALLNASGRAVHAQEALVEIIKTMGWNIVDDGSPTIPVAGMNYDVETIINDPILVEPLRAALNALVRGTNLSN